jgi:hypothetical protein
VEFLPNAILLNEVVAVVLDEVKVYRIKAKSEGSLGIGSRHEYKIVTVDSPHHVNTGVSLTSRKWKLD